MCHSYNYATQFHGTVKYNNMHSIIWLKNFRSEYLRINYIF